MTVRTRTLALTLAACLAAAPLAGCRGTTKADYAEAETQWSAAVEDLDPLFEQIVPQLETLGDDVGSFDGANVAKGVRDTTEGSRTKLQQTKAFVEGFDDSAARKQYLASLDSAVDALDALDAWAAEVESLGTVLDAVERIGDLVDRADKAVSAANGENNANDWAGMKAQAAAAAKDYAAAVAAADAQHKVTPKLGFDAFSALLAKKKSMADQLVVAGDAARAGRVAAYNAAIDRFNALNGEIDGMKKPALVEDPDLLVSGLVKEFTAAVTRFEEADAAHEKAYRQIEKGDY